MQAKTTQSRDNIFVDPDFPPGEAVVLQLRVKLMSDLRHYSEQSKLAQQEAAGKSGITKSRVSDLVRGKWEKFSLEVLISLETRLGRKVSVELVA